MTAPTFRHCSDCAAWESAGARGSGLCVRYAPRPVMSGQIANDGHSLYACWPSTDDSDGCCDSLPLPAHDAQGGA